MTAVFFLAILCASFQHIAKGNYGYFNAILNVVNYSVFNEANRQFASQNNLYVYKYTIGYLNNPLISVHCQYHFVEFHFCQRFLPAFFNTIFNVQLFSLNKDMFHFIHTHTRDFETLSRKLIETK